ncbi:hypothetical protein ACIRR9_50235, partial [Streptomyces sp. NPDC101234]
SVTASMHSDRKAPGHIAKAAGARSLVVDFRLADDGTHLGRRLADAKVTSETHTLPEGQHSFILAAGRVPEANEAITKIGNWLHTHLNN